LELVLNFVEHELKLVKDDFLTIFIKLFVLLAHVLFFLIVLLLNNLEQLLNLAVLVVNNLPQLFDLLVIFG